MERIRLFFVVVDEIVLHGSCEYIVYLVYVSNASDRCCMSSISLIVMHTVPPLTYPTPGTTVGSYPFIRGGSYAWRWVC